MRYTDLKQIGNAPLKGWLLVYYRDKVKLHPYSDLDEVREEAGEQEILEIHLFDKLKEYRAVVSRSPRYSAGLVEHVADFPADQNPEEVYQEEFLLDPSLNPDGRRLRVIQHLNTRNQMIVFDDYRMVMEET